MQIFYIKYYCLIADTNFVKQRIMRLELARSIGAIIKRMLVCLIYSSEFTKCQTKAQKNSWRLKMLFRSVFVTAYFSCLLPTRPAICILSFVNLFDFSSVELKLCIKTIEVQISMTDQRIIFKANNQKKSMSKTACLDHQSLKACGKVFWCVSASTSYFRFYNF